MDISITTWSLHRHMPVVTTHRDESGVKRITQGAHHGRYPIDLTGPIISIIDFPRIVKERYGINKVELCQEHILSQEPRYLAAVRGALEEAGVSVLDLPIDVGNISLENPDWRAEDIAEIKTWIDTAEYLGSPCVRVNSGQPQDIKHFDLQITINSYKELAAYCASKGMTLLLENEGSSTVAPTSIAADPHNIIRLVEAVASPAFKLCPDFGRFKEEERYKGLEMMFPHTVIVHAKTHDFNEAGEQDRFDFGTCMEIMKASGYNGPISIEFGGPRNDEYEGIALTKTLIERYL